MTGKEIKQAREALDLSQGGLAYKAGISQRTVERVETGETMPNPATLTVIEAALRAERGLWRSVPS